MTIIYFILILGITVFVHELGHFLLAKKAGIYVYEFSLGMGPRLFKFNRKNDETEYGIRLFPLGGFVRMAGEEVEVDEKIDKNKRMQSKTWLQRFLTIIAGVMFNFIFCILMLFIVGLINGCPNNKPIVGIVNENSAAYNSGIKVNDEIIALNGKKVNTIDGFNLEYQVNALEELELKVLSNGEIKEIRISPIDGVYGFGLDNTTEKGFFKAIKYAFTKFISLLSQMFRIIGYLFTGKLSINNLSGPVGIYNVVGESARAGFVNLIYLLGYICLNVGVINLLPIPAFDGGRILFLLIEKVKGSPINQKTENIIHSIGFILLMLLMAVICYNDIIKLISG